MAEIARQQGGINSDLANVTADIPGIRQDYAAGVAKTAQDAEQRATTLYNSGMITQRQYAQALGLPNWQSYPNQAKGSAPRVHYYKDAAGNQWVINEATGKAQRLPGLAKPAVDKPPSQFGGEGIGYFVWQKVGNTWVPKRVIPPKPAAAGATFTQTWQTLPNGNKVLVQRNSKSGAISIVTSLNKGSTPSQPTINGAGGAPMTPTQINEAGIKTASAINVARRKGIPLQVLLDSLERNNIPIQIYMPKIAKAYNIPLKIRDPAKMDVNALYRVATLLGYRPKITATTSYVGVDDLGKQRPFFPGDAKKNAAAVAAIQNKGIAQAQKDGDIPTWVADVAQVTSNRRPAGGRNHDQLVQWVQAHLPKGSDPTDGSTLIAYATQQLGQPYVWGGESRKEGGFDCSGLVDWVMRQEGYTGPRVTTYTLAKMGTSVKGQPLQPGDLIITHNGGHVVMYAGNGKVIAAPHTGSKVQYQPLSNFKQEDVRRLSAAQVPGVAGSTPQAPGAPPVTGNQKGYKPIAGNPDDLQTPKGARGYAFTVASDEGWGGAELKALDNLWYGESKWNYKAKNGSSGALGIPQALGHKLPPDYANNATAQVDWGINYIKNRYRTPSRAWAFWQATVNKNASLAPPDLRSTAAKWIANGWGGY
jgi:cell wall-associated NlpC family hydrolase